MTDMRLSLSFDGPVAHLAICRSEKLNALDAEMIDTLLSLCRHIDRSDARAVILTGEGKAFCAGGDIAAWSALSPEDFGRRWLRDGHQAFDALARLRQPLIAVLNGHCLGGGLELAACADLRIAEAHVKLGLPETGLGVIPGWSGTQRASRRFGAQLIRRMALMAEVFSADQALALGLVDQVVPSGQGMDAATVVAHRVLARSPRATEITKQLINAAEGEDRERTLEMLAGALVAGSDDLAEGLSAYREKRQPHFGGKD
ncbi:MAG: enoyl-CoA hydratase/isomerase family protein [Cypionkella sp.]|uniref:enoyl-CoA hydratase/isomerase family protein n=1 Tax=Cypionkella sp. TaxID=2811411 RepID=UPI002ABB0D47|nr:enoyl-CoA hydratase/isomerase family protein [Cypionkella sp.]MDZ4310093.1 enoyl-CoA hydratase/isomerase family protein [Cypionkella sp.]